MSNKRGFYFVELGIMLVMLFTNELTIFGPSEWPRPIKVGLISVVLGILFFAEQGERSNFRNVCFRKNPSQGFVVSSIIMVTLCLKFIKLFEEESGGGGEQTKRTTAAPSIFQIYVHYTVAMFFATIFYGILYILNIDITFIAPVVILLLGFLQDHFIDVDFIIPFTAIVLYFIIFSSLNKACPRSFTLGEAAIISQGITFLMIDFSLLLFVKCGYGKLLETYNISILENRSKETMVLSALLASSCIISVCLVPILYCLLKYGRNDNDRMVYSAAFYVGGFLNTAAICVPSTYFVLATNPLYYFQSLMKIENMVLVSYWLCLIAIAIAVVIWNTEKNKTEDGCIIPKIITRKAFHFIAIFIYAPGLYVAPDFIKLASGVAVVLLVICEYMRIFRIYPFGDILNKYMKSFVDEKDSSFVILTHIYLLLGFSVPLWLFSFKSKHSLSPLLTHAGLISLGIGDSFASIIGSHYGVQKIPGSQKTVVGFFACFCSQFVASMAVILLYDIQIKYLLVCKVLFIVFFTAAIEGITSQIDNLVLPLVFCCITLMTIA